MKAQVKTTATLKITNCSQCPFIKIERHYTADSLELAYNWFCTKKPASEENHHKPFKKIAGYVGWTAGETDGVQVPKWCPIKTKTKK